MNTEQPLKERLKQILNQNGHALSFEEREILLHELIDLHGQAKEGKNNETEQIRQAFLHNLCHVPQSLTHETFSRFFAENIKPADFRALEWEMPEQYFQITEALYLLRSHIETEKVFDYVTELLVHALRSFERNGEYKKMIELLQLVPVPPSAMNQELLSLRAQAHIHETRRVQHFRQLLYKYLFLQALLIFVAFPILFVKAENGAIAKTIEEATDVEMTEERVQYLSYADGLYWSIITAASIGYGDITPVTNIGRIIAAILGSMGVITIGIIAGLILDRITPRNF